MNDRKIDISFIYYLINEEMKMTEVWNRIAEWLGEEKLISLPKGKDFRAFFNSNNNYIEVVPTETGIPRRISKNE